MEQIIIPKGAHIFSITKTLLMQAKIDRLTPIVWKISPHLWDLMRTYYHDYLESYAIEDGLRPMLYGIPVIAADDEDTIELVT